MTEERDGSQALAAMLPGMIEDLATKALASGAGRLYEEHSPEVGELIAALCEASLEFGEVVKDREAKIPPKDGKSGYSYEYATLASINAATDRPLAMHGLRPVQTHPQTPPGVHAVRTTLWHKSGQYLSSVLSIELARAGIGAQALGTLDSYLRRYSIRAMLNLAPVDDDDAAGEQGRREENQLSGEQLGQLAPSVAFGEVKKVIAAIGKCDGITAPRVTRLYTIASKDGNWKREQVDAAVAKLLGIPTPAGIPWKAYELVVNLFGSVGPEALKPEKDAADEAPAAPEPPPTWPGAWEKIAADHKALPGPVAFLAKKDVDALLEGFARRNWTPQQVATVLRMELNIPLQQIPADGSNPPVLKKIRQIFRLFGPGLVPADDRVRYGWDKAPLDPELAKQAAPPDERTPWDEDPEPTGDGEPTAREILSGIPDLPDTADEMWKGLRMALEGLKTFHREALVPITDTDKAGLSARTANGGRSSADVAGLVWHYLGVTIDFLPAMLFPKVREALMAYPSRKAGREAPLLSIPANEADIKRMQIKELRELMNAFIVDGLLADEEIPKSGDKQSVTKEDMWSAVALVRERALMEAGTK